MLISLIVSVSSSKKLVEAEQLNVLNAREGTYVTTELVLIEPFYESYTEKNGTRTSTNYYYCFAIDTNYNKFIVKTPYTYYTNTLSVLENNSAILDGDENIDLEIVTVYGTVKAVASEIASSVSDYSEDDFYSLFTDYQVDLYRNPKTEGGGATTFAVFMSSVSLIMLIAFLVVRSKYKKTVNVYNDYGDIEEIFKTISQNYLYSDRYIIADRDYIISKRNHKIIISTEETLCLYEYVHRTNFVVDEVALIAINKYGEQIKFRYGKRDKDEIPNIIVKLKLLCPKAVLGFSNETKRYVAENNQNRKK